jgi:hypothetical protein
VKIGIHKNDVCTRRGGAKRPPLGGLKAGGDFPLLEKKELCFIRKRII